MLYAFRAHWKFLVAISAPVVLTAIPVLWKGNTGKEPFAAYGILLMAIYWMTECIPLAVTSFLPVVLFPIFGIVGSDRISTVYLQDSILFLLGGVIIALAVEYSNLHTRIAVKVILLVGAKISRLLLGIMLTTMFLSMWMNNTSTTAMMVPIVNAIMEQLRLKMLYHATESPEEPPEKDARPVQDASEMEELTEMRKIEPDQLSLDTKKALEGQVHERIENLKIMFLIATAYASNIGGTGVITGSATNVIALDLIRKDADQDFCPAECKDFLRIGFLDWMLFNVPPMVLNTIFVWIYLQVHFLGIPTSLKFWQRSKESRLLAKKINEMESTLEKSIESTLREKYEQLGSPSLHEMAVLCIFVVTVILWIFKDPQFMPGWDALPIFKKTGGKSLIKESTPTLLMCFLLFAIPKKREYYQTFFQGGMNQGMNDTLLNWKYVEEKFPWGIFILLGGGSAMALGSRESGLNRWVAGVLETNETLQAVPPALLFILMLAMLTVLTTLASNTACAAIITPVLLGLSYVKDMHPLYLVMAATTTCSYAFMLPVSTPPNAIVYSAGSEMKFSHMMKAGFVTNIICLATLFLTTHTVGDLIYGFGAYDGQCSNMTILASGS